MRRAELHHDEKVFSNVEEVGLTPQAIFVESFGLSWKLYTLPSETM
jgi:hypothetical protein